MASEYPLQSRADCKANFDLIRSWISQCERHPICTRVPLFAPEIQLPTRLIDINPGSEDITPRLVISADLEDTVDCRYVALSHCWGDPRKLQVPKTLQDTLKEHQKQITTLTKTFKDAIEVTRQIGVRYLWIDSLCIVQDEPEDFKKECSMMSYVYARAYCVLSAIGAEDGSGGLFIPRNSSTLPSQISLNHKQWKSILHGPLSTRGWAFQEHQLSTRIIHFTTVRILWECRVCIACEDSPSQRYRALVGGTSEDLNNTGSFQSAEYLQSLGSLQSRYTTWRLFDGKHEAYDKRNIESRFSMPGKDVHTRWLRAVELYSSRKLTYETDRLPAISGLAAAAAALLVDDDYLAGLWNNDLIRGLLWIAAPSATKEIPDVVSSIPSWSWASYGGSINFMSLENAMHLSPIITLDLVCRNVVKAELTAYTNTSGLYHFWEVEGGTLQITGRMKTYDIGPHPDSSSCEILNEDRIFFAIYLDHSSAMIHLGVTFAVLVSNHSLQNAYGLILKKSETNMFQRLGIFYSSRSGAPSDFRLIEGFKFDTVTVQ